MHFFEEVLNALYSLLLNILILLFLLILFLKHLKDPHSSVRCQCLCLIGHLSQVLEGSPTKAGPGLQRGVRNLLASFSEDSDPRVRTSALQALVS